MIYVALAVAATVAFVLFRKFRSKATNFGAAMNALLAKHTLYSLEASTQEQVMKRAEEIYVRCGGSDWEIVKDGWALAPERFGLVALAMRELSIPPATGGRDSWYVIDNPFRLGNSDPAIPLAQERLRRTRGIDVGFLPGAK